MYYRPTAAQIAEVEANRIRRAIAARAGAAASPARAPAVPAAAADPVAQARKEGEELVQQQTREVAALLIAAGRPDLFVVGATVAETRQRIALALWDDAFAGVDARSSPTKPATNAEALWSQAFARADARGAAEPESTTGSTPAASPDSAAIWDAAYRSIPNR